MWFRLEDVHAPKLSDSLYYRVARIGRPSDKLEAPPVSARSHSGVSRVHDELADFRA